MTSKWDPQRRPLGNRIQAGIPLRPQPSNYASAGGLLLRGVVTVTYELDNGDHPETDTAAGEDPVAIYCDVLIYSGLWNQRFQYLRAVLVTQEVGGIHRGRVWKPRASKIDITESDIDLNRATNPANLDGDHVLVGFLDDNLNQPAILRGIPHPAADTGNAEKEAGKRIRLKVADGDPDFWKHHGAFFGVSDAGDFVVDTTEAYVGPDLETNGNERSAAEDGSTGNYAVKLPKGSTVTVEIEGGANLLLEEKDGDAKITVGDGTQGVCLAQQFQTFWDTDPPASGVKLSHDQHLHGTAMGPSGIPTILFPVFKVAVISTKAKVPDG